MIMGSPGRPSRSAKRRTMPSPRLWNVEAWILAACVCPTSFARRSRSSPAALFVNVTAATRSGSIPRSWIMWATRDVITRVLPVPGPARTISGPSSCVTARRWASLRPAMTDWYSFSLSVVDRSPTPANRSSINRFYSISSRPDRACTGGVPSRRIHASRARGRPSSSDRYRSFRTWACCSRGPCPSQRRPSVPRRPGR